MFNQSKAKQDKASLSLARATQNKAKSVKQSKVKRLSQDFRYFT
jgi:hypothetical protein